VSPWTERSPKSGAAEPLLRLAVVEEEVPRLVQRDPVEKLREHGMSGQLGEPPVAHERRQLVDGPPGHVQCAEVRPEPRQKGDTGGLQSLDEGLLPSRPAPGADRVAGRLQEAREREAVKRLLVEPAGQERRDVRLVHRAGREKLAEVDDRVTLDVLHVAEGPDRFGRHRMARDVRPGERGEVDASRPRDVGIEV